LPAREPSPATPGPAERDLRDFYTEAEVASAARKLKRDQGFQELLRKRRKVLRDAYKTSYPLKYLGIEIKQRSHRFPLDVAVKIALQPRSMDGASKGLRYSVHRRAFIERFPDVDALLSDDALFRLGPKANVESAATFAASEYGERAKPALARLQRQLGLAPSISLQVLRKGLAAYKSSHRPGMSAHGWARARLTSFVMKGCTHFFPDHLLAARASPRVQEFWKGQTCLCAKKQQCSKAGVRTRANAL
jgi:hypothetical protein